MTQTNIWETIKADYQAIFERDPAARTFLGWLEAILCYSGFHAVIWYRISNYLHTQLKIPVLPRYISQLTRWFTGVEIHPGATIGKGFFIDHGMGVVIGETAVVGDNVTLYQGVTLGGTGKQREKRHPTIGNDVVVGAGAKVLGNITVGHGSRIGAGSVVVKSVPENCTVVGVPGEVVKKFGAPMDAMDHTDLPDPLEELRDRVAFVQTEIDSIESSIKQTKDKKKLF